MKILLTLISILFCMNAMAQRTHILVKSQLPGGHNLAIGAGCLGYLTTQSFCICITDKATENDMNPTSDYYYHVDYNTSFLQTPKGKIIAQYLKEFEADGKPKSKIKKLLDYIRFISSNEVYLNEIGMICLSVSYGASFCNERLVIGIQ